MKGSSCLIMYARHVPFDRLTHQRETRVLSLALGYHGHSLVVMGHNHNHNHTFVHSYNIFAYSHKYWNQIFTSLNTSHIETPFLRLPVHHTLVGVMGFLFSS